MISIGLPAYKSKFIDSAINSILNQTYKDFELIIVNDNSPENLEEIIDHFNDPRIRYYKNENNIGKDSLVKSWNKCLEYAKGEYFILFSDDDIYEPTFLQELFNLSLKYPDVDLFHARVAQINSLDEVINFSYSLPEYEDILDFISNRFFFNRIQFAPDFMVKTEALRNIGGFYETPIAWGADDITWISLAKEKGIVHSNKILCKWRISIFNISAIGNIKQKLLAIDKYENWFEEFLKKLYETHNTDFRFHYLRKNYPNWFANQRKNVLNTYKKNNGLLKTLLRFFGTKSFNLPLKKAIYYTLKA
ncbi:MAG: glycosyltransferase family 2 protein [Bacteroidales bacterium]